jgi:hypothetical protein
MEAGLMCAARFSRSTANSTGSLVSDSSIRAEPAVTGLIPSLNQRASADASTHHPSGVSRTTPSASFSWLPAKRATPAVRSMSILFSSLNAHPDALFACRSIFIGRSRAVRKSPKTMQVPSGV